MRAKTAGDVSGFDKKMGEKNGGQPLEAGPCSNMILVSPSRDTKGAWDPQRQPTLVSRGWLGESLSSILRRQPAEIPRVAPTIWEKTKAHSIWQYPTTPIEYLGRPFGKAFERVAALSKAGSNHGWAFSGAQLSGGEATLKEPVQ